VKNLFYLLMIFVLLECDNSSSIVMFDNYDDGLLNASEYDQNILLIFDFLGNPNNSVRRMIYSNRFYDKLQYTTIIILNVDDPNEGNLNRNLQINKYGTNTQPMYYLLDSKGEIIKGPKGYCTELEFANFIE